MTLTLFGAFCISFSHFLILRHRRRINYVSQTPRIPEDESIRIIPSIISQIQESIAKITGELHIKHQETYGCQGENSGVIVISVTQRLSCGVGDRCIHNQLTKYLCTVRDGPCITGMILNIHNSSLKYYPVLEYDDMVKYCKTSHSYPREQCLGYILGTGAHLPYFLCTYAHFDIVGLCHDASINISNIDWGKHIVNPFFSGARPQFHISFFYLIRDLCKNGMNWRKTFYINNISWNFYAGQEQNIRYYMQLPEALLSILAEWSKDNPYYESNMLPVFHIIEDIVLTVDDLFFTCERISYGLHFNTALTTTRGRLIYENYVKFVRSYHQRIDLFTLLLKTPIPSQ